jgi:hypothetical protein
MMDLGWSSGRVLRLESIVSGHPEASHTNVNNGNPTLKLVVPGAMHPVGETH